MNRCRDVPRRAASSFLFFSHETSMKILYNMDSGWCYRGESDCE